MWIRLKENIVEGRYNGITLSEYIISSLKNKLYHVEHVANDNVYVRSENGDYYVGLDALDVWDNEPVINPTSDDLGRLVVRGKDWTWGDQDGFGRGIISSSSTAVAKGWVRVEWKSGGVNTYRCCNLTQDLFYCDDKIPNLPKIPNEKDSSSEVQTYLKDSYVVLLETCDGNPETWESSIPVDHVYKLSRDSFTDHRGFNIYKDINGNLTNGWSSINYSNCKLKFRYAEYHEIEAYNRKNGPVHISDCIEVYEKSESADTISDEGIPYKDYPHSIKDIDISKLHFTDDIYCYAADKKKR